MCMKIYATVPAHCLQGQLEISEHLIFVALHLDQAACTLLRFALRRDLSRSWLEMPWDNFDWPGESCKQNVSSSRSRHCLDARGDPALRASCGLESLSCGPGAAGGAGAAISTSSVLRPGRRSDRGLRPNLCSAYAIQNLCPYPFYSQIYQIHLPPPPTLEHSSSAGWP